MKNAIGVEVNLDETDNYLENATDADLTRYAVSTKRDIKKYVTEIKALEEAALKVITLLKNDIKRKQNELDENQAFSYRIFLAQSKRKASQ